MVLKNFYILKHSLDRKTELLYWPSIDLILWGVTSLYFRKLSPQNDNIVASIVLGIIFWYFLWEGQAEVNFSFLVELWHRNLVNLFITPLKFSEFVLSFLVSGLVKIVITFSVTGIAAYLLYQVHVFDVGLWILPFALILILFGWAYAFMMTGVVMRKGTKIQSLTWTTVFLLAPFSAVYYPISVLPDWAQSVSKFLPSSYVFEGMRSIINSGDFNHSSLLPAFGLCIVYLAIGMFWIKISFNNALKQGLVKLR
jgi:ABC-2 type transport system permease protein